MTIFPEVVLATFTVSASAVAVPPIGEVVSAPENLVATEANSQVEVWVTTTSAVPIKGLALYHKLVLKPVVLSIAKVKAAPLKVTPVTVFPPTLTTNKSSPETVVTEYVSVVDAPPVAALAEPVTDRAVYLSYDR